MKQGLLLIIILVLSISSNGQSTNKKLFNSNKIYKTERPDTGNAAIPFKPAALHNLEFHFGLVGNFKLNNFNEFMKDFYPLVGYKYYHPLKKRYLFVSTTHGFGFFDGSNDKKISYLSFYEIGMILNKATNYFDEYGYSIAVGIFNYNYYTRNPIYFINNNNEIDQLEKLNATFVSLRFDALITSYQFFYNLNPKTRTYSKFGFGVSVFLPIDLFKK